MPKLTYTVAGAKKTVDVTDSCSIGRMAGNTIAIEDEVGASRRHCQILKISSGFELSDLGSTNGTKVNGQAVKRHKLKDGDEIRIGETAFIWSDGTGAAPEDEVLLEGDVELEEPAGAAPKRGAVTAAAATSEQCYLVFAGGPKDGQKITLEKKRVTFGRNAKNTNVFADDAGVSGYHCEVAREGGAYVLRDLGSTNGTLLDGEAVSETALQHGNRIRIGGQRLVFVDPTVSDFEKAMSAVDDLGSEWGLLRAEMDMSRVQQAKRSQMVGVGAAIVLLGGAGFVAIAHPEWISGGAKAPENVPGNQVADFSFEGGSGTWSVVPGSPSTGRPAAAADGPAKQGKAFYSVSRDGPTGRGAAVMAGEQERIRVDPSKSYAFGASVRTKGDAQACVRVTWLAADKSTVVGESATDLASGDSWTDVRQSVAQPPRDAASARIELVNARSGTAFFDDVFFAPAESKPVAPDLKGGDLMCSVTADGQATLRRGTTTLFTDLTVVGGALHKEYVDGVSRTDRVGAHKASSVTSAGKVVGQAMDAVSGKVAAYSVQPAIAEDRYLDIDADLGDDAALVGLLEKESVEEGLGVRTDSGFFRMSDIRSVEKVRSVTFGERNRFEVLGRDGAVFRFALTKLGDRWAFAIGGAPGLKLRVDTDKEALKKALNDIDTKAKDAVASRRYGLAIQLLGQLAAGLPQGTPAAAEAATKAEGLESAGRDEIARIHAGRVAAVEFQDDSELAAIAERSKTLVQQYEGHEVCDQAKAEIAAVETAKAQRKLVLDERAAAPLIAKADDYASRDDWAVAGAIYRGVVAAYPGTETAKKAKQALESAPAGK